MDYSKLTKEERRERFLRDNPEIARRLSDWTDEIEKPDIRDEPLPKQKENPKPIEITEPIVLPKKRYTVQIKKEQKTARMAQELLGKCHLCEIYFGDKDHNRRSKKEPDFCELCVARHYS